ncbi:MAG: sigma-70 family RNA polymerase sigma factor [Bacteroidales bacterium]|nr:sigma-70 family RNA polymerase sigma factor [Bacteroidales bacterium]
MEELYIKAFPAVARCVKQMGGNLEDARDIFHDALIIYTEQKEGKIIQSDLAYLKGITRHLWVRKFSKSAKVSFTDFEQQLSIPDDYFPSVNNRRLIHFLELAGRRCIDLLRAIYFQSEKLKSMGFSNEHSASVQKYKCLEKVRKIVKEKSLQYDDFLE